MQLIFAVQFIFTSSPQINNKGTVDVLLTLNNWTVIFLLPSTFKGNHPRVKMSSPNEVTGVEEHRIMSFTSWFPDKIYRADEKSKLLMKPKHSSHLHSKLMIMRVCLAQIIPWGWNHTELFLALSQKRSLLIQISNY